MDEPGWNWPAWKFGLKRDDLFTTLNDQYNIFSCSIQDPEAFHHDVYEISNEADTVEAFHCLMATRRQQRLEELNQLLETAAVEIIANPDLIGTEKWKLAVQVFRTRSLDALVAYFSSYLPEAEIGSQHMSSQPSSTVSSPRSSFSDNGSVLTCDTKATDLDSDKLFFLDDPLAQLTDEPLPINTAVLPTTCAESTRKSKKCALKKCPHVSCLFHERGLRSEWELRRHVKGMHSSNPDMFECSACPYKSKRESNCKQHMKKVHGWLYQRSKNAAGAHISSTLCPHASARFADNDSSTGVQDIPCLVNMITPNEQDELIDLRVTAARWLRGDDCSGRSL